MEFLCDVLQVMRCAAGQQAGGLNSAPQGAAAAFAGFQSHMQIYQKGAYGRFSLEPAIFLHRTNFFDFYAVKDLAPALIAFIN